MREFFREIVHALEAGQPVELVSVAVLRGVHPPGRRGHDGRLSRRQPSPAPSAAAMWNSSASSWRRSCWQQGADALRQFRFVLGDAASLGMVCGGGLTVQLQYLPGGDAHAIAVLRDLMEADGGSRDTWLLRRIEGERVTAMGLADRTGCRHLDPPPADPDHLLAERAPCSRRAGCPSRW